jgi:hypothetical protein
MWSFENREAIFKTPQNTIFVAAGRPGGSFDIYGDGKLRSNSPSRQFLFVWFAAHP